MRPQHVPAAFAAVAVLILAGSSAPLAAQQPHADGRGEIDIALTGDAIITRALRAYDEPEFLALRDVVRSTTVAFTNLEVLFHEFEDDVVPAHQSGGTYMAAHPDIAGELSWMGFDLVSRANNHTMDYGYGGMRATTRAVEAAGLVHAGAGENLAEARAPAYIETPGGRVALISVASTFSDHMRAGPQRGDVRGRPGLSPIRYQRRYVLPRTAFEALRDVREGVYGSRGGDESIRFAGETFVAGDAHRVETEPHAGDLEDIARVIAAAKGQANWVVVSSHSHEGGSSRDVPADFLVAFARATIDAGADVFVGHGPHVLRGIEIYDGKPIFYSLGDFVFQNETVARQPADNFDRYGLSSDAPVAEFYDARNRRGGFPADPLAWEGVVAIPSFSGGELAGVELHPVTLGHGLPRPQRGRPLLATGDLARKIIGDLQRLSEPFGTNVEFRDGIGVIHVGSRAATDRSNGRP